MAFNSVSFIVFFLIVSVIYYFLKKEQRTFFLIFSSFIFIGFQGIASLIIFLLSISTTFFIAKKIAYTLEQNRRRFLLRIGLFSNLALLFFFKYFESSLSDFSLSSFNFSTDFILIALGISFYTLQNISFLMEVYSNRLKFEYGFTDYLLFSSFFPKFIMGPITLPQDFLPQIKEASLSKSNIHLGIQRIVLGLVKKIVIADRLSMYINHNYKHYEFTTGITSLSLAYMFTIQLFFDFSGYTDIAIGTSKILDFDLKENFQFPLRARSIAEFWRNWHISLSSWITKYVFYPLSFRFRKIKKKGLAIAILATFIVSGIWHGIGITFIVYALSHAFYMIFGLFTKSYREKMAPHFSDKLIRFTGIFLTFNLVSLSFVYFRATTFEQGTQLIQSVFDLKHFLPNNWYVEYVGILALNGDLESLFNFAITSLLCCIFVFREKTIFKTVVSDTINIKALLVLLLLLTFFGIYSNQEQFIYNQF